MRKYFLNIPNIVNLFETMKKHKYYYRDKIPGCIKNDFKLQLLKAIKQNVIMPKSLRQRIMNKITLLNNDFHKTKLKKFCIETGRLRFIINDSKYSRIVFRKLVSFKYVTGYYKNG